MDIFFIGQTGPLLQGGKQVFLQTEVKLRSNPYVPMSRIHPNPREVEMKSQKLLILTSRKLFVGPGSMLVKGKQMHDVLSDEALKERGWPTSLAATRCSSSSNPGLAKRRIQLNVSSGDPTAVLSTFFAREAFYHIVFWNFDLAKYVCLAMTMMTTMTMTMTMTSMTMTMMCKISCCLHPRSTQRRGRAEIFPTTAGEGPAVVT